MKNRITITYLIVIWMLSGTIATTEESQENIVYVLSNSIDDQLAQNLYTNLEDLGIKAIYVTAKEFDAVKENRRIIILGGQNSPEGVGEISGQILSDKDKQFLVSSPDATVSVTKNDVWAGNQKVFLYAGHEKEQTFSAWKTNLHLCCEDIIFSQTTTTTIASSTTSTTSKPEYAGYRQATLYVYTYCPTCPAVVSWALERNKGVVSVKSNPQKKIWVIIYKPNETSVDYLRYHIAGYDTDLLEDKQL